ncbi:hypothetical protein HDU67_004266 [Dinochytrium kinnereticum]|nr:hypothetical protein HDU67_004266 [Dinochytrium kinnereticum]
MDSYLNQLQALMGPSTPPLPSHPKRSKSVTSPSASRHAFTFNIPDVAPSAIGGSQQEQQQPQPSEQAQPLPTPVRSRPRANTSKTLKDLEMLSKSLQARAQEIPITSMPPQEPAMIAQQQQPPRVIGPSQPPISLGQQHAPPQDLLDFLASASSLDLFKGGRMKSKAVMPSVERDKSLPPLPPSSNPASPQPQEASLVTELQGPPRMQRSVSLHASKFTGETTPPSAPEFPSSLISTKDFMATIFSSLDSVAAAAGRDAKDLSPSTGSTQKITPKDQLLPSAISSEPLTPPTTPQSAKRKSSEADGSPTATRRPSTEDPLAAFPEDVHRKLADMVRSHRERRDSDATVPKSLTESIHSSSSVKESSSVQGGSSDTSAVEIAVAAEPTTVETGSEVTSGPSGPSNGSKTVIITESEDGGSHRQPRERSTSHPAEGTSFPGSKPLTASDLNRHRHQNLPPPPPRLQSSSTNPAPVATSAEPEKLDRIIAAMMMHQNGVNPPPRGPITHSSSLHKPNRPTAAAQLPLRSKSLNIGQLASSDPSPHHMRFPPPPTMPPPPTQQSYPSSVPPPPTQPSHTSASQPPSSSIHHLPPAPKRTESMAARQQPPHQRPAHSVTVPAFHIHPQNSVALPSVPLGDGGYLGDVPPPPFGPAAKTVVTGMGMMPAHGMSDDAILAALKNINVGNIERLPPRKASLSSSKAAAVGLENL